MTTKGSLTREQAVSIVGEDAVKSVERENCEPTGRVGFNGECQGDALIEWCAVTSAKTEDGDEVTLSVYYYTDRGDEKKANEAGWDCISWEISGYEVA